MYKILVILFIISKQLLLGELPFSKNIMEWSKEKTY